MTFPSLVSQILYIRGVETIGANRASLFINLIPLFGAVGAVLVLGEHLQAFHLIAGALITAGIALAEWSARRG
jgi:drug/metabolite transporter (DMT)-like permease